MTYCRIHKVDDHYCACGENKPTAELLPCPFCGVQPIHSTFIETESVDDCRVHRIQCGVYGIASVRKTGPWFEGKENIETNLAIKRAAFEAWNRRAAIPNADSNC